MHPARALLLALCVSASPALGETCAPPLKKAAEMAMVCPAPDGLAASQIMNAQAITMLAQVNNGAQLQLAETGKARSWLPTLVPIAFDPLCKGRGNLWWGINVVSVMPAQGTADGSVFRFCIPGDTNVQSQFQLYVLWNGGTAFRMLVLLDGLFFALLDPQ